MKNDELLKKLAIFLYNSTNSHDCISDARKILTFLAGEQIPMHVLYWIEKNCLFLSSDPEPLHDGVAYIGVL